MFPSTSDAVNEVRVTAVGLQVAVEALFVRFGSVVMDETEAVFETCAVLDILIFTVHLALASTDGAGSGVSRLQVTVPPEPTAGVEQLPCGFVPPAVVVKVEV